MLSTRVPSPATMLPHAASLAAPAAAPARVRLHGLTGLRFFAAAWVFAYHFLVLTVAGAPWWTARLQNAGHAAVSLFFVLSGFVLAYNYAAPLADGRVTRARFWWLRLARVWPLYVLVALVEVPLALHAGIAPARIGAASGSRRGRAASVDSGDDLRRQHAGLERERRALLLPGVPVAGTLAAKDERRARRL